jgi:hypothetical protein
VAKDERKRGEVAEVAAKEEGEVTTTEGNVSQCKMFSAPLFCNGAPDIDVLHSLHSYRRSTITHPPLPAHPLQQKKNVTWTLSERMEP